MRTTDTFEIKTTRGDLPFTITQLPAMQASKLIVRLGGTLGPAVATLAKAFEGDVSALSGGIRALFERLTEEEFEALTRRLLAPVTVTIDGEIVPVLPAVDTLFRGYTSSLFLLLGRALQVNYADFSDALARFAASPLAQKLAGAATRISSEPPRKPGSTGLRNG